MKNKSKGFTLIELLVVIAIIGVLSSIVLASLNGARNKATDVAIKENLVNARSQAALYYDVYGSYGTNGSDVGPATGSACNTSNTLFDPSRNHNINPMILSADKASKGSGSNPVTNAVCGVSANGVSWVVYVPLVNTSGGWCVSPTISKASASAPASGVYECP